VLTAARELSRPVYIEFPKDMVDAEVAPVPPFKPTPTDPEAATAAAAEILARLEKAASPALILCVEVRRYGLEKKVAELAKKLAIPTATTFMARGILAGTDAPLIGTYLGLAGEADVRTAIEGADALLMLGVILCDTSFGVSETLIDRRRFIHAFDREVRFAFHTYSNVPLEALVDALLALARPLGKASRTFKPDYPTGLVADGAPILPEDIARAVNDHFARHSKMPIASDMGDCLFTAMDIVYTELVAPAYYLVGDGAFQMTGWELGNCRRYGLDPIVVLFNNCSWEMLRVFQPESAFNDLSDWNFAAIAPSLGGHGVRVTTRRELRDALDAAVARRGQFSLIEVMLKRGETSQTLHRFVTGFKAARERLAQSK